MTNASFNPNWASPPGDTMSEILLKKGLSREKFSKQLDLSEPKTDQLLLGKTTITNELAKKLGTILGSTESYWIKRESQYQEDLLRYEVELKERKEWIKNIPVQEMIKSGWIDKSSNKEIACLQFFGILKANDWYEKYNDLLAITAFKVSASYDSAPESVVTWLRRGEIVSNTMLTGSWNESKFKNAIIEARKLTRISDPQKFIPKLQNIFSKCGVAVVVEKAPTRCRASGAAYFIEPTKAVILLSGRYLSDDHFWFCFFHEAGHILLHGNKKLFLELDNNTTDIDGEENEANLFAEKVLIPEEYKDEFLTLNAKKWKQIVRFAKKINISTGIVVGQLQQFDKIDRRYLNKLKKRYKWDNAKLVTA